MNQQFYNRKPVKQLRIILFDCSGSMQEELELKINGDEIFKEQYLNLLQRWK